LSVLGFPNRTLLSPHKPSPRIKIYLTSITIKTLEVNQATGEVANDANDENKKTLVEDIEEDEGIDNDDDEEKALVENEPEQNNDDDNTLDTTTNTNTTTENTTTTIINDSDPAFQWKEER
jgi:hypothetical protein